MAYSGGADSSALLYATVTVAAAEGLDVVALHVNHRLHRDADRWEQRARTRCRRWAAIGAPLSFDARRVAGAPARGESVEAWARASRYRALAEMAHEHGATIVLLAHHRRDQAETFLLQALRGGGAKGLAAMPRAVERGGIVWARPWLAAPREAIERYRAARRLPHVDDDSNTDARYARSRLRLAVMPALRKSFPHAEAALCRAAHAAHGAAEALAELAAIDLGTCSRADGLVLEAWLRLSLARRDNALRAWLAQAVRAAPATLVARLLAEWPAAGSARTATWPCPGGMLRSAHGELRPVRGTACAPRSGGEVRLSLVASGDYDVPSWRGTVRAVAVESGGVPTARLASARLVSRSGGERFQAGPGRPARSLKKQYQAMAVPAGERGGPLVYDGDQLLYVPRLGIDARAVAAAGEPQLRLEWLPWPRGAD